MLLAAIKFVFRVIGKVSSDQWDDAIRFVIDISSHHSTKVEKGLTFLAQFAKAHPQLTEETIIALRLFAYRFAKRKGWLPNELAQ